MNVNVKVHCVLSQGSLWKTANAHQARTRRPLGADQLCSPSPVRRTTHPAPSILPLPHMRSALILLSMTSGVAGLPIPRSLSGVPAAREPGASQPASGKNYTISPEVVQKLFERAKHGPLFSKAGALTAGVQETTMAYTDMSCELGFGYDMANGCVMIAIDSNSVYDCTGEEAEGTSCVETNTGDQQFQSYMKYISDSKQYSDAVDITAEAEGSGWGVTVSAGMTSLKNSKSSTSSVTFYVGGAYPRIKTKTIKHPDKMKLAATKRAALVKDPATWISTYGLWYVYKVTYGGSFTATYTLTETSSSSSSSLDVFAKVDVSDFYSASVSGDYNDAKTNSEASFTEYVSMSHNGGKLPAGSLTGDATGMTPEAMGELFTEWKNSMEDNVDDAPAALTLTWRRYWDLEDVQAAVDEHCTEYTLSNEDCTALWNLFRGDLPTQNDLKALSNEYLLTVRAAGAADSIVSDCSAKLPYYCDAELVTYAKTLNNELNSHMMQIDHMDVATLSQHIQEKMDGDYSWWMQNNHKADDEIADMLMAHPYPRVASPPLPPPLLPPSSPPPPLATPPPLPPNLEGDFTISYTVPGGGQTAYLAMVDCWSVNPGCRIDYKSELTNKDETQWHVTKYPYAPDGSPLYMISTQGKYLSVADSWVGGDGSKARVKVRDSFDEAECTWQIVESGDKSNNKYYLLSEIPGYPKKYLKFKDNAFGLDPDLNQAYDLFDLGSDYP